VATIEWRGCEKVRQLKRQALDDRWGLWTHRRIAVSDDRFRISNQPFALFNYLKRRCLVMAGRVKSPMAASAHPVRRIWIFLTGRF